MNERISFLLNKKFIATGRNKGFVQNIFPQDRKTASNGKNIWEMVTEWFPLAWKSIDTSQNEESIEK